METSRNHFVRLDVAGLEPAWPGQPLWLLDIDGVINAFGRLVAGPRVHCHPSGFFDFDRKWVHSGTPYGGDYLFTVAPLLLEHIRDLHGSGQVQIAWLTTWCHRANSQVSPAWDLPEFPVAAIPLGMSDHMFKTHAAVEALRLGRPIVWTDDDAVDSRARGAYETSGIAHLLIEPDPMFGLTGNDVESIRSFVGEHGQRPAGR